jgi:hypothetical protein
VNRRSLIRKLIYAALIVALLFPLSYFSLPATARVGQQPGSAGGKLAQMRDRYNISPANLGEIDPTGETVKLATLGLRNVAVLLLWEQANTAFKKENWEGMQLALDQLANLEPHFIRVWRHQGWNVSFNISVEFDDYHDRYFWLKEGIKYLLRGYRYNELEPLLLNDVSRYSGLKIGVADEKVQYRQLFRKDDDPEFPAHGPSLRPENRRDNWLVGQEYALKAIELVDNRGASIHQYNPFVFHGSPAMCQIDYGIALEGDGVFGEKAREAWGEADRLWRTFAARQIPTSLVGPVRLNEREVLEENMMTLARQLDGISPGLREKMVAEKRAQLAPIELQLLDTPIDSVTQDELPRVRELQVKTFVGNPELVDRIDDSRREDASKLAQEISRLLQTVFVLDNERSTVNYQYWTMRCQVEKTDAALEARRLLYQAKQEFDETRLIEALEAYQNGFAQWRLVLDEFPPMVDDDISGETIHEAIRGYVDVLKQLDEPFPDDFALRDVLFSVMRRNPSFLPFELVKGAMMKAKDEFEARFSTIKNADENRGDDEADAETEQE